MARTRMRLALGLLLTVGALLLIGAGSLGAWTAVTTNPGNSFATGTLLMTNSDGCSTSTANGTCSAILSATNMKPGSTATGTVTITNTGTLAGDYSLSEGSATVSPGGNPLCGDLTLSVTDDASTPNTVYSGALNALPSTTLSASNPFAATNGAHTFTFTVTLPSSSSSSDQGATCTASFTWTAVPH